MLLPQGAGALLTCTAAGRLTDAYGGCVVATGGFLACVISTAPFLFLGDQTGSILLYVFLFIRGLAIGMLIVPITTSAFRGLPDADVSRATVIIRAFQQVGGSFGTAASGRGCCDRTDGLPGGNGERGRLYHVLPGAGGRFGGGRCRFPDISPVKMNQKTSSPHRPLCGIMSAERSLYHRAYRFLRPPQKAGRIRRRQHVCEADML